MKAVFGFLARFVCGCLLGFALLALGVACGWNWIDYWRSLDWVVVEGKLVQLEAKNSCPLGRNRAPESGHCCELQAEYTYAFETRNYSGSHVGVEHFGDPRARSKRYSTLKEVKAGGLPVRVWVNPRNPAESTLFKAEINHNWYFGILLALAIPCVAAYAAGRVIIRKRA